MKQLLFYTGLSIILVAAFSSCSSEVETTSSLQQIYEEDVDVLSSEYASLYKNLVGTIFKECKKISVSESDIDLNEHFKNFSDVYFSQLSPKELALINRKSYSSETRNDNSSAIVIPEDFIMQIKSIMFDANVNLLTEKIEEFYVSPYFLTLHQNEQKELKLQLETLAKIRNSWIEILIEYYQPQATTRMSPGDRLIWSDIAKQMNHKQQSNLIDASLYGIGIVCGPIPAGVVGAIALAKSIFWP